MKLKHDLGTLNKSAQISKILLSNDQTIPNYCLLKNTIFNFYEEDSDTL